MECFSCLLRYNQKARSPLILSCGHSLCKECFPQFKKCPVCTEPMANNPKPNYSLLEMIDKDSKPIDKFIKVCFVGSSAVGKTSLIRKFMCQDFTEDVATTIGYDFTFKDKMIGPYCVRFQFWDSAGQERYRAISPIHYKNSHVVIIVYNVCANFQDNRIAEWIEETDKHAPPEALKIIVGNKLDLLEEGKMYKPIDDEAWDLIKEKRISCYETSCKSGVGVESFEEVLEKYFFERKKYDSEANGLEKIAQIDKNEKLKIKFYQSQKQKTKINKEIGHKNSELIRKENCC